MRCYNGCPDKELQAVLDDAAAARKEIEDAGLRATYFPAEEKWMLFRGFLSASPFFDTLRAAADSLKVRDEPKTFPRGCQSGSCEVHCGSTECRSRT